jgi:hypothetical protein
LLQSNSEEIERISFVQQPPLIGTATELLVSQKLIFKGQIDQYIRQEAMLQENMQRAYSLVLGQCSKLLRAKLKQSSDWAQVSSAFDVLGLTKLIKSIVFKFDDQKFLPVSLYQAKQNFCSLCQGTMMNAEYLEKFSNYVDITLSYGGEILDAAVLEYTRNKLHPGTAASAQTTLQRAIVRVAARELCLGTAFILQCDRRRYGKLLKELENNFTKGHNNYPQDMVKAYQLLNEYKQWRPTASAPQSEGVAFAQGGGKQEDNKDWAANKTCYECAEKGHIKPDCSVLKKKKADSNDNDDATDKDAEKLEKLAAAKKKKDKDKKAKTFIQKMAEMNETDKESSNDVSFCNIDQHITKSVKLKNMLLLDNQLTVDLFCNKKLVKNISQVHDTMTVMGKGGTLTTKTKAGLKGYGKVWFNERAITNILSLKNVSKKQGFHVPYDSDRDQGFAVHKPNGKVIHFRMHPDGLHYTMTSPTLRSPSSKR